MEPRTLKLIELENEHYLKLVDVERLLRDMRREILDNSEYETLEDGTRKYHHTESETARLNDLYFVSSCIKRRLVMACESPDEIRALHERIRKGYYFGKYYLSQTERDESGKPTSILYFRKYCPGAMKARLEAEGKTEKEINEALELSEGDPVFSDSSKDAKLFESMEEADSHKAHLNYQCKMKLKVSPAFLLDHKTCKRFLDKLLNGDGEGKPDGD